MNFFLLPLQKNHFCFFDGCIVFIFTCEPCDICKGIRGLPTFSLENLITTLQEDFFY